MFKLHELREIIKLMDQSSLQRLEIESEGSRLTLEKGAAQAASNPVRREEEPPPSAASVAMPAAREPEKKEEAAAAAAPPAPSRPEAENAKLHHIVSPMVGTFYQAPAPDAPPYVKVGDKVKPDTVVCIVEAMKLMNEIEAEVSGEIVEVLVKNGELVEYGQPLFTVRLE